MVLIDVPRHQVVPDRLNEALAGQVSGLSPSIALALVAQSGLAVGQQRKLLRTAAKNPALESHVRAAAALTAIRLDPKSARAEATDLLSDPLDDRVAGVAAAALGRYGDAGDLPRLRDVAGSADSELLRARASFAATLIVHRLGLANEKLELLDADKEEEDEPGPGALTFDAVIPGVRRRLRALDGVRAEFPETADDQASVFEIQCGPRLLEVIVPKAAQGAAGLKRLLRAPALSAVVAALNEETEEFYPSLLVLTRPVGGDRVRIEMTRPGGEPLYTGVGTISDRQAVFRFRAVRGFGSLPVDGRVRLGEDVFEVSGRSERRGKRKQVPKLASEPGADTEE